MTETKKEEPSSARRILLRDSQKLERTIDGDKDIALWDSIVERSHGRRIGVSPEVAKSMKETREKISKTRWRHFEFAGIKEFLISQRK